jgi:hypothetical protein
MRPIISDTGAATTAPALATMFDDKFHGAPFGHMKAYYNSRASDRGCDGGGELARRAINTASSVSGLRVKRRTLSQSRRTSPKV